MRENRLYGSEGGGALRRSPYPYRCLARSIRAGAPQLCHRAGADGPAGLARGGVFIATMTASLVNNSGRSAWFVGILLLMVYAIFATTLFLLPPRVA